MRNFKIKIRQMDFIYLYILFLFFMPNDVFKSTSLYIFDNPSNINQYEITMAYLSLLYMPLIIIGILIYIKNNKILGYNILLFLFIIFLKDVLIATVLGNRYMISYNTYEMYWVYAVSISIMAIVFYRNNNLDLKFKFFELFGLITCLTTIFSAVTGIGVGNWETYTSRYHASSMSSGETAYALAMFTIYLIACKNDGELDNLGLKFTKKYRLILIITSILLIFATGCRKDLIYVIGIAFIYKLTKCFHNTKKVISKKITKYQLTSVCFIILAIMVLAFNYDSIGARLNLNRMAEPIEAIMSGNANEFLSEDDSSEGRIESIVAGLELAKNNVLTGLNFSFYDMQYNLQRYNYPTFPHSTILYYYCICGVLIIIPVYLYIKTFYNLIKLKSTFLYVFLHFFIHNTISGGAYLDIKSIIQNLLILSLGIFIIKNKGWVKNENRDSGNKF